ncbi:MAG: hypothetical protein IPN17_04720 [Deltaproteobacteria bacterium]|nr:hypothetical protein [Deltaproteobacteria bacterium]
MTSSAIPLAALALLLASCAATSMPAVPDAATTDAASDAPGARRSCSRDRDVDLLFVIDNSGSMNQRQSNLARGIAAFVGALVSPPTNPATGRPIHPPARSLRIGAVSTDLGTPGSTVPPCSNSDVGDDGRLNPIRYGHAIRSHQPWTAAPAGARPARCTTDPAQYPSFLSFDAASSDLDDLREDYVCYAYLAGGSGCGLEQPLEAAYRALVVHDARDVPGNVRPNAGFLRDDAVLGIVVLSDEDDGSVRDCRYAEAGAACADGTGVFDSARSDWASTDLNLRFYMYEPGGAQDPTWNLDRYLDPPRPLRGFTAVKPGAPQLVVFGAITGVPLSFPQRPDGRVDWTTLLGSNPDGSDGYVGMSPEGPISMRQRNMDPGCSTRVVPSCRREGSAYDPARPGCDTITQPFAYPSRRIAEVVRRFDEHYQNGVIGSICRDDYAVVLGDIAQRIGGRFCP